MRRSCEHTLYEECSERELTCFCSLNSHSPLSRDSFSPREGAPELRKFNLAKVSRQL